MAKTIQEQMGIKVKNSVDANLDLVEKNPKIWRYMDFTKLVQMLDTSMIYFSRSDRLGDKFEGSYPRMNLKKIMDERNGSVQDAREYFDLIGKNVYINCWCINNNESMAMWKLFTKQSYGVAITSTIRKYLIELKNDESYKTIYANKVEYIDYELKEPFPEDKFVYPFFFKRKSFEYENEFRAIVLNMENFQSMSINGSPHTWYVNTDVKEWDDGIEIKVSLQNLIDEVYISPESPEWYKKLVEKVVSKFDIKVPVLKSSLDDEKIL